MVLGFQVVQAVPFSEKLLGAAVGLSLLGHTAYQIWDPGAAREQSMLARLSRPNAQSTQPPHTMRDATSSARPTCRVPRVNLRLAGKGAGQQLLSVVSASRGPS